jgi:hypothetical protein
MRSISLLVNANARNKRLAERLKPVTLYGQLRHIFGVTIQPAEELELEKAKTIILAAISECKITAHNDLDIHYYHDEGALQVVDQHCAVPCRANQNYEWQRLGHH